MIFIKLNLYHYCDKCSFKLTEQMCDIMDFLPEMQSSISEDSMMGLVYIAGFLIAKDKKQINEDNSHFYYEKFQEIPSVNGCTVMSCFMK